MGRKKRAVVRKKKAKNAIAKGNAGKKKAGAAAEEALAGRKAIGFDVGRLAELLSPKRRIEERVKEVVEKSGSEFAVMLIASPANYSSVPHALLRLFSCRGEPGIYITVNKPFINLRKELEAAGIMHERFRFIDVISSMMGFETPQTKAVEYLDSPSDLTEVMVLIQKRAQSLGSGPKFLVLDSVSAMLIYNDTDAVEKFIHAIIGKIHEFGMQGILLMVGSEQYRGVAQVIGQFCDKIEII